MRSSAADIAQSASVWEFVAWNATSSGPASPAVVDRGGGRLSGGTLSELE
jgi:hypothetical protein